MLVSYLTDRVTVTKFAYLTLSRWPSSRPPPFYAGLARSVGGLQSNGRPERVDYILRSAPPRGRAPQESLAPGAPRARRGTFSIKFLIVSCESRKIRVPPGKKSEKRPKMLTLGARGAPLTDHAPPPRAPSVQTGSGSAIGAPARTIRRDCEELA